MVNIMPSLISLFYILLALLIVFILPNQYYPLNIAFIVFLSILFLASIALFETDSKVKGEARQ